MKKLICKICNRDFNPVNNTQAYCSKKCAKIFREEYNKKHGKIYRLTHVVEIKTYMKKYNKDNQKRIAKQKSVYRFNHSEKIRMLDRKRGKIYREGHQAQIKKYRQTHKNKKYHLVYCKINHKRLNQSAVNRRKTDINFRIRCNLRIRLNHALRNKSKHTHMIKLLGCSVEFLRCYLLSKFTSGMSWKNYGYAGWHIDHIKPCASFDLTKPEEQSKCFNYLNLQPMWALDNISKGDRYEC